MKILSVNLLNFTGKRQDRKNVEQLKNNNPYDLNVINQRRIHKSIDNLANVPGEENVRFLMDVSKKLKYGTNIDLGKASYNDWQVRLNDAARKSIEISPKEVQPKLYAKLDKLSSKKKPLTATEQKILDLRKSVLSSVDRDALNNIKNENIKNLDRNLDYFISSSEVPIAQKLYIMKKLDYLMSPKYQINEQLADKKTQVLAEIVNDIVINTPESKIPNIKSVNQLSHGMCAAISICRKALAYEDKPHFVDIILSELDNKPTMKVYDISQLGTNAKIPVEKPYIDFKYAMEKGYRIIDASALNWMNIADTTGRCNEPSSRYIPFDKAYFDTFSDIHIFKDINDELAPEQDYYRALVRSQRTLKECKKDMVLRGYNAANKKAITQDNIVAIQKYSGLLSKYIGEVVPEISNEANRKLVKGLLSLEVESSRSIKDSNSPLRDFMYLENEQEKMKLDKIKKYILANTQGVNSEKLEKSLPEIFDIVSSINNLTEKSDSSYAGRTVEKARDLYKAAAAYRMQYDFGLENENRIREMSKVVNIPDGESLIIQNIDKLIGKLQKGTLNPEIKETLMQRFAVAGEGNPDEMLMQALEANKEAFIETMTGVLDSLYASCLMESRKAVILKTLTSIRNAIVEDNDRKVLDSIAEELNLPTDKRKVLGVLDKFIETLSNENSTEEQYIEIYNKLGGKNQLLDYKTSLEKVGNILYSQAEQFPDVVKGFNMINGLTEDASIEETHAAYQKLVQSYAQMVDFVSAFQEILEVRNENGEILNTVVPKNLIMKKLEDSKEIVSERDLRKFQEKFAKIDKARRNPDGTTRLYKDLPTELTRITPSEKEVLKNIEQHINGWYSATTRNLSAHHKEYQEPIDELAREIGVLHGDHWVSELHSGLSGNDQVRIIEQMTGRPYYMERNTLKAIEKIKNSPYSGVSTMSMKSDEIARHAQYIVDLKPVKVMTPDGIKEKDSLFHDNSWGPIEHRNVWVDENGLIRTDYSMGSGGELGFITGTDYRSGKLLENLLDDVGEVKPENINSKLYKKLTLDSDEEYKFKMFDDIITPGIQPNIRSVISNIKDNTTIPADTYLEDLENYAKDMTRDELQQKLKRLELYGEGIQNSYENIENRIWGKIPGVKEIATKEDFDNLKPDDKLKLLFEKVAILQSYDKLPDLRKIYAEPITQSNLNYLKGAVRKEARKNFDYSFAKSPDIAKAGARTSTNEVYDLLEDYQKDTHVKISVSKINLILKSLGNIDNSKFNGSLDNTIELMLDSFRKAMTDKTLNCENKDQKINELVEKVRPVLRKNMYLNKEDMSSIAFTRDNVPLIEKWIDDNFDPVDDDEFVKIYNNMQNMTTAEFKEKYNYLIDDKALGIKPVTGYDVLKKFRALETRTENAVFNNLFHSENFDGIENSRTVPYFAYTKLSRISKGSRYVSAKRSFDDIYLDYYNSLRLLNLDKIYGKYKDDAYKRYGSLPAYAKVEFEDEQAYSQELLNLYQELDNSISTIVTVRKMISTISDLKKLRNLVRSLKANDTLTETQGEYIMDIMTKFQKDYEDDESLKDEMGRVNEIVKKLNEGNSTVKDYKPIIIDLANSLIKYEKTSSGTPIEKTIKIQLDNIEQEKFSYIMQVVDPRYHKKAFEMLNKWIKAKSKELPDADLYYVDFEKFLDKHKMIKSPEQMLNDYLLLLAKPTKENNPYKGLTKSQQQEINDLKGVYQESIASLLVSANLVELQNLLMQSARNGNLNMIKDELKNTQLKLTNGKVADFYSDAGLSLIMKDMFDKDDLDTALMFIDQLGIGERVIEMYNNIVNIDGAKRNIKRIHSVLKSVDTQVKIVNREVEKLADIESDPNYEQRLVEARERILKSCNRTNFRLSVKNIDKVLTAVIEEVKKKPKQAKYDFIKYNTDYVRAKNIELAKNYVDSLNGTLERLQAISKLIMNINLPKGSKAEKTRKEFFEKLKEVQECSLKYSADFENINLATKSDNGSNIV